MPICMQGCAHAHQPRISIQTVSWGSAGGSLVRLASTASPPLHVARTRDQTKSLHAHIEAWNASMKFRHLFKRMLHRHARPDCSPSCFLPAPDKLPARVKLIFRRTSASCMVHEQCTHDWAQQVVLAMDQGTRTSTCSAPSMHSNPHMIVMQKPHLCLVRPAVHQDCLLSRQRAAGVVHPAPAGPHCPV